jgi:hypothetical protein
MIIMTTTSLFKMMALQFCILVACSPVQPPHLQEADPIKEINIRKSCFDNKTDYTDIISNVEFIKLETNNNCLIGNILKIDYFNQNFYILDKNRLLIFDSGGNFLNALDKIGRGPEEYIEIRDFYVDEEGSIFILSYKNIVVYDSNLKFLYRQKIKLRQNSGFDLNPVRFLFVDNNYFYFYSGSFGIENFNGKEYGLYCANKNGKLIEKYVPVKYNYTHGHQNFYRSENVINFTNTYGNDTIYQIVGHKFAPNFYIKFVNSEISEKDMMEDRGTLFEKIVTNNLNGNIKDVYETDVYLSFNFSQGRIPKVAVYNKLSGNLKVLNVSQSQPIPFLFISGIVNNKFYTVLDSYVLNDIIKKGYKSSTIENGVNVPKPNDNPIIAIFNLNL